MTPTNIPGLNTKAQKLTVKDIIEKFFGDLSRWPVEPDGRNFTQSQIQAVCQHIFETGDCLWHAQYIVMKWEICHCADCCNHPV